MASLFLVIIYLAFISLGLPDSLLGVAWPLMQVEYRTTLEAAGLVSMVIAGGTIISSLASGAVLRKLGTGKVVFISCFMTAASLLGFYFSPSLIWILLFAIPLGLGAGSIDSGLNNYVAMHYKAHHMSWLHCFWGVGATLGPMIMAQFIKYQNSWRNGYLIVSEIQFMLVIFLFITLPLWNRVSKVENKSPAALRSEGEEPQVILPQDKDEKIKPLHIKGVKLALLSFLFYCAAESTMGLWGSSFLIHVKGLNVAVAAQWVSLYYAGITVGRFITGFVTFKVSNKILIRMGQTTALTGAVLLILPLPNIFSLIGFIMVGLGCAPIFPCMLHETPTRFGKEHSQMIIGYQMALAYTGSTCLPPLLGGIAARTTIGVFPYFDAAYIIVMLISSENINALMKVKKVKKIMS